MTHPSGVRLHDFTIRGVRVLAGDIEGSAAAQWIANELCADEYQLERIDFRAGDVVVDVGAHVGLFALYLARRHPRVTVIAFEPEPRNFQNLAANIALNRALNVIAFNLAITADGRPLALHRPPANSGGAGAYYVETAGCQPSTASSMTLDELFARLGAPRCKLLKLDCEGAEHEILPAFRSLHRVEWFAAEFHMNRALAALGHDCERLRRLVERTIPPDRMAVKSIAMGE